MASLVTERVPVSLDGERVDKIVAVLAGVSRAEARAMVDAGQVFGETGPLAAKERLSHGSMVSFPEPVARPAMEAEEVEFGVVYVDDDLVVVDKPAGVVVHPGAGRAGGTLAAGLLHRFPEIEGVGQEGRWGIVHRLDRETSGLLVVARSSEAYTALVRAMRRRAVVREYVTMVQGTFSIPRGTVDAPIGRDPHHPTRRAMLSQGRPAVTHYRRRVEWDPPGVALLEVTLETGRTHQIRVHLAGIGHPVLGDRTYGGRDPVPVPRLFLHAARLELDHPTSGEPLAFDSPMPPDLDAVVDRLNAER